MNEELYEKLARLQWLLHRQHIRGWARGGPMADTTRGQGRILAILKMKDGISTKDLSYLLGVRVSSLNELLAKLEKSSYITREPSERDKRVMLVRLTEKGRSEESPDTPEAGDIFACLSGDERRAFGEFLDRIIGALTAGSGGDEEWFARMRTERERLAPFIGGQFHGRPHGFTEDRGRHGGFAGYGGFGLRDENEDE
ncbi:MAG: MarR family transcriptional regulator [Oscillospiraceae bacterium]|jgi:DNA-binding MarR family transcriptional regulator|nr:MarR family transcriptional regulator [Oscillospiraceae bacterium]